MAEQHPLCVDLDETLVRVDTLWESIALLFYRRPLLALLLPLWLLQGKSSFKARIAEHVRPDAAILPYRESVLAFLRAEHEQGRQLVLASAADQRIVDDVAQHLGIFSAAHGSSAEVNLGSGRKAKLLQETYGTFDYIGDCAKDIPIWAASEKAYIAGGATGLEKGFQFTKRFEDKSKTLKSVIKLIRPHQWLKNALIFLPLILAFRFQEADLWLTGLLTFACFSCIASVVYVINDCLDIENDRHHPKKSKRPLAAGTLSIPSALVVASILLVLAVLPAIICVESFALLSMLLGYLLLTSLYTFYLKRVIILDVLILAGLFTYRIITGAVVMDIVLTPWLLAFSMFLFSSLAMVKRWIDLIDLEASGKEVSSGRGYQVDDRSVLLHMGSAAAMCTVLVFSLYINDRSSETPAMYAHPQVLWLLCPLLMYWLMRIWFLASRGRVHEDPVMFAAKDKTTYLIIVLGAVLLAAAKGYFG